MFSLPYLQAVLWFTYCFCNSYHVSIFLQIPRIYRNYHGLIQMQSRDEWQNSLCTVVSTYHILLSWGSGTHQPFHCDYCIQTNVTDLLANIWALEKRHNIHNVFKLHQQISITCSWVKGILCKVSSSSQLCLITMINANEKSLPLSGFQPSMRVCLCPYLHI